MPNHIPMKSKNVQIYFTNVESTEKTVNLQIYNYSTKKN